jgi:hypothetical protein
MSSLCGSNSALGWRPLRERQNRTEPHADRETGCNSHVFALQGLFAASVRRSSSRAQLVPARFNIGAGHSGVLRRRPSCVAPGQGVVRRWLARAGLRPLQPPRGGAARGARRLHRTRWLVCRHRTRFGWNRQRGLRLGGSCCTAGASRGETTVDTLERTDRLAASREATSFGAAVRSSIHAGLDDFVSRCGRPTGSERSSAALHRFDCLRWSECLEAIEHRSTLCYVTKEDCELIAVFCDLPDSSSNNSICKPSTSDGSTPAPLPAPSRAALAPSHRHPSSMQLVREFILSTSLDHFFVWSDRC